MTWTKLRAKYQARIDALLTQNARLSADVARMEQGGAMTPAEMELLVHKIASDVVDYHLPGRASERLSAAISQAVEAANQRIAELEQVSGDICARCGWAFVLPSEECANCERNVLRVKVEAARAEERAECIKIVRAGGYCDGPQGTIEGQIAAAIRSRGTREAPACSGTVPRDCCAGDCGSVHRMPCECPDHPSSEPARCQEPDGTGAGTFACAQRTET